MADVEAINPGNPNSKPWQWPREWWHDEKFWREVATRTIAGVIAALIILLLGYLSALVLGILAAPTARQSLSVALLVVAVALILTASFRLAIVFFKFKGFINTPWLYIFSTFILATIGTILAVASTLAAQG